MKKINRKSSLCHIKEGGKKTKFNSLFRLIPLAISVLLASLSGIPSAHAATQHYECNSDYLYYQGHKVGAASVGVHWDDYSPSYGLPRIELGCSMALGPSWGGYYKYIPQTDCMELQALVVSIWIDKNRNNQLDGSDYFLDNPYGLVRFVLMENGYNGASQYLAELVGFIYNVAVLLSGVALPSPFSLIKKGTLPDLFDYMYTVVGGRFGSLYARIDYQGWETGYNHITLRVDWMAYFRVWYMGPVEGRLPSGQTTLAITPKSGWVWWGSVHLCTYIEVIIDVL